MQIDLNPLTISERPHLERVITLSELGGHTPLASWAFAPHFIWRDLFTYSWADINGWWCLFAEYSDGMFIASTPPWTLYLGGFGKPRPPAGSPGLCHGLYANS